MTESWGCAGIGERVKKKKEKEGFNAEFAESAEDAEKREEEKRARFIVPLLAGEVGGAEVEVGVEFAIEEGGVAFGVADVFGGIATDA